MLALLLVVLEVPLLLWRYWGANGCHIDTTCGSTSCGWAEGTSGGD